MANYVLIYNRGSMPQTEAERASSMQAWGAWYGGLGNALVDPGNPFTPRAKNIASNGTVSDGPVGTMASGYTVVQADSLDEAVDLARNCPVLQTGGQVTVYETFKVM
jgi:hypothetical protein